MPDASRLALIAVAQIGHDLVVETVERSEIDMPAFGFDDMVVPAAAHQLADPCGLQAGMFGGFQRARATYRDDPPVLDLGNGKAGVRSSYIDRYNFGHMSLSWVASIAGRCAWAGTPTWIEARPRAIAPIGPALAPRPGGTIIVANASLSRPIR